MERALGAAYVVEGSTLGGAFIRSRLPLRGVPTSYLQAYGPRTGEMWKRFLAVIESARVPAEPAVTAARETFLALGQWLHSRGSTRGAMLSSSGACS